MQEELESLAARDGVAAALVRVRCLPPARLSDAQWERLEALLAVLPHAVAELMALFAERKSVDHSAVAAAARDALRDDAAPTELALALDYRIRHLLVDEYQDTSPAQERLLALLLAGWQRGDGRTLFCVGDPMQSIYAFREADVTLFLQAAREGVGGVPLEALRLGRNFRSSRAIVDWVNASFAALLPSEDDSSAARCGTRGRSRCTKPSRATVCRCIRSWMRTSVRWERPLQESPARHSPSRRTASVPASQCWCAAGRRCLR